MSLTTAQAETDARTLTRHDADTRFTSTQWKVWANKEYRRLRTWLRGKDIAPEFALLTSQQAVGLGGTVLLSSVSATLEGVHLVEWDATGAGNYREMARADSLQRNVHRGGSYTFRQQAGVLTFGPDGLFEGTVRVHYHNTPADLIGAPYDVFIVPAECELPIVLRTCGWIAVRDGEGEAGRKAWEKAAEELLKEALPALKAQHGIHPQRAGLHEVLGY